MTWTSCSWLNQGVGWPELPAPDLTRELDDLNFLLASPTERIQLDCREWIWPKTSPILRIQMDLRGPKASPRQRVQRECLWWIWWKASSTEDTDGPQGWNWPETSPTEDTDGPQGWNWTKASPTERIQMDLTFLFAVSTLTGHAFGELLKIHGHNACK